jgi:hypothetical protein
MKIHNHYSERTVKVMRENWPGERLVVYADETRGYELYATPSQARRLALALLLEASLASLGRAWPTWFKRKAHTEKENRP